MEPFTTLEGIAAPLRMINVDTDIIIPKQFLKTIQRAGLGKCAFYDIRYDENGQERANFILNRAPFRDAKILVTGKNFGCGSSREHAPWALLDFGLRCVIAPSFADIFYNNSFKNGILPIILPEEDVEKLMQAIEKAPNSPLRVDLHQQTITHQQSGTFSFTIDPFRKHCLINGLDDIGLTEEKSASIDAYEEIKRRTHPWL